MLCRTLGKEKEECDDKSKRDGGDDGGDKGRKGSNDEREVENVAVAWAC